MNFEWDINKEHQNELKHGISFAEAVEYFSDPRGIKLRDKSHSQNEERLYWVGRSKSGRILTTRFTMRSETIRIIGSAEWRRFRKIYETTKIE